MIRLRMIVSRLAGIFGRSRRDVDLSEEIASHLELLTAEHRRRGLSPRAARAAARRDFGGVDQMTEQYRDQRGLPFVDSRVQDLRYATRSFRHDPIFSLVTVFTLALGIGAATAVFGGVKAVLLDVLPYPRADRIAAIDEIARDGSRIPGTFGMYRGLAERTHSFDALAVSRIWQPTLTGVDRSERLDGQRVSYRYFDVFDVHPALGRSLLPEDDRPGSANVAIVSNRLWQRRFSGDPSIVGRRITLDDQPFVVVGVMPAAFENVLEPSAEIWTALQYDMSLGTAWGHHLQTIGRLRPGISFAAASGDAAFAGRAVINDQHPATYSSGTNVTVVPLGDEITRAITPSFVAIGGAVILMLVVACVNVTSLLLARGARRHGEFTIRVALGAGRGRLVGQLLTESLLLSAAGGVAGVLVARLGVRLLVAAAPAALPRAAAIAVDRTVLLFAIAVTTLVGVLVGLVPALQSAHDASGIREAGQYAVTPRLTTRRVLIAGEVAIAFVLLVMTGLLFHSLQRLFAVSPGFDPAGVITMQVQTSGRRFDKAVTDRFFERARLDVRALPGVRAAGFTSQLPFSGDRDEYGASFEGDAPGSAHPVFRYAVTPGYVETMGIPLRRGRSIDVSDSDTSPRVAMISESLARRHFGAGDPIGRHVHLGPPSAPWYTIVGVAGDVHQLSLALTQPDAVYIPARQSWFTDRRLTLVARAHGEPSSLAPAIRDAIASVDADQPVLRVMTMDRQVSESAAERTFAVTLFEVFGASALLLATIGLYGVLSGTVAERTRELAIRTALGATRSDVVTLVVGHGMRLVTAGIAAGLIGSAVAGRSISTLLFGISSLDTATYISAIALLLAVASLAAAVPAWRASRVDPMAALRQE